MYTPPKSFFISPRAPRPEAWRWPCNICTEVLWDHFLASGAVPRWPSEHDATGGRRNLEFNTLSAWIQHENNIIIGQEHLLISLYCFWDRTCLWKTLSFHPYNGHFCDLIVVEASNSTAGGAGSQRGHWHSIREVQTMEVDGFPLDMVFHGELWVPIGSVYWWVTPWLNYKWPWILMSLLDYLTQLI